MSRQSNSKANSTRLPPKTNLARKQSSSKPLSKKAKLALMEREKNRKEELSLKLKTGSGRLINILESGGVSKDLW